MIHVIILLLVAFPLFAWISGRIAELMVNGQEERVPDKLKGLVKRKYIDAVRRGEKKDNRWKFVVAVFGLAIPIVMFCSATSESIVPRLLVVSASAVIFFGVIAVFEWLVWPK